MNDDTKDILISRLVDGDATGHEWDALVGQARTDPALWQEIAEAQRDHVELCGLVERAGAVAARVPAVPGLESAPEPPEVHVHRVDPDTLRPLRWLAHWSGWAVAAMVVLAWMTGAMDRTRTEGIAQPGPTGTTLNSSIVPVSTPEEALQAYYDMGREQNLVIREMPSKVLLETRPDPSGRGFELIYIRQVMERTVVPDLYRFSGEDEEGRPALVRYQQPRRGNKM